jgi:hypothetical protein
MHRIAQRGLDFAAGEGRDGRARDLACHGKSNLGGLARG